MRIRYFLKFFTSIYFFAFSFPSNANDIELNKNFVVNKVSGAARNSGLRIGDQFVEVNGRQVTVSRLQSVSNQCFSAKIYRPTNNRYYDYVSPLCRTSKRRTNPNNSKNEFSWQDICGMAAAGNDGASYAVRSNAIDCSRYGYTRDPIDRRGNLTDKSLDFNTCVLSSLGSGDTSYNSYNCCIKNGGIWDKFSEQCNFY